MVTNEWLKAEAERIDARVTDLESCGYVGVQKPLQKTAAALRELLERREAEAGGVEVRRYELIPNFRRGILNEVSKERDRQDAKHGSFNITNTPNDWASILAEEVGELARECHKCHWHGARWLEMRDEAIHVAAVAVAIVEAIRRRAEKGE
ncbi:MAG: hypothetical protein WC120_05210 [Parcubacteria group bacterium]